MSTFLTIMSFPFWFFAIILMGAALTGGVTVNERKGTLVHHIVAFVAGLVIALIAACMCQIL
jgi:hypothetical protein